MVIYQGPDQSLALKAQFANGSASILQGIPNGSQVPPSAPIFMGTDTILFPYPQTSMTQGTHPQLLQYVVNPVTHAAAPAGNGAQPLLDKNGKPVTSDLNTTFGPEGNLRPGQPYAGGNPMTVGAAQMQWYNMTLGQKKAIAARIFALGYIKSPNQLDQAQQWLNWSIGQSALSLAMGQYMSPFDWLSQNSIENADELARRKAVGPGGIISSPQINIADKDSAEALATQALTNALGRAPTQHELDTFYNTLVAKEKANPTIQQNQVDSSGNVVAGSTQTVQQGFGSSDADVNALLDQQIANNPEARALQAVTGYLGVLQQALGSPGGVGKA